MLAIVREIVQATPTACLPRLKLSEKLSCKPGQYILVVPKIEGSPVIKPYSVAASSGNEIELCIRKVGRVSNYVCGLKPGDRIELIGPGGEFVLNEVQSAVVFVATGTGISSIRPMIEAVFEKGTDKDVWLFFGNKSEDEIIYRDYFDGLAEKHRNFHFIPVLSRPDEGWKGERGHVQDALKKHIKNPASMDIYICGVLAMVEEAAAIAEKMGFKNVYFEKYV